MIDLLRLLDARPAGFSLPAPLYTDPAVFDADMDLIFARHWIFVGSEPELAEAGDYLTVDLGRHAVVVLRDDDNEIRAFHNVCRHRGARLLAERPRLRRQRGLPVSPMDLRPVRRADPYRADGRRVRPNLLRAEAACT